MQVFYYQNHSQQQRCELPDFVYNKVLKLFPENTQEISGSYSLDHDHLTMTFQPEGGEPREVTVKKMPKEFPIEVLKENIFTLTLESDGNLKGDFSAYTDTAKHQTPYFVTEFKFCKPETK